MKNVLIVMIVFICSVQAFGPAPAPTSPGQASNQELLVDQLVTDGSKPNLPSGRIIGNSVRNAKNAANDKSPVATGDFFEGLTLGTHYSYTSFYDGNNGIDSSGYVDERAFTLSGRLSEDTTLTLGYSRIKYRYGRTSPAIRLLAHGLELSIHHDLNDNYGIGGYGFFQDIDVENSGDTYSAGGGLLFTTIHDLNFATLSTASTLTYVDYDFDDDYILLFLADLSRDVTDWMSVGVNATWTDSITDNGANSDDNYWTLGAEVRFNYDDLYLSVGYEKTYDLSDYKDNTINVSLTYTF
jgi:hypothetical protein